MPTLAIKLQAQFADFQKALTRVERDTGTLVSKMQSGFQKVSAAVGTLGIALGAGAVVAGFRRITDEVDQIGKRAQGLGVTTEALSTYRYAAQLAGVQSNEFENAIAKLNRKLFDAKAGIGEAGKAFKLLGVDVRTLNNSEDAVNAIANAFFGMEDGILKTKVALTLFEESGAKFVNLLNQGSVGLAQLKEELREAGGLVSVEDAANAARFNDELTRMSTQFKLMGRSISSVVVGPLADFLESIRAGGDPLGIIATDLDAAIKAKISGESLEVTRLKEYEKGVDDAAAAVEKLEVRIEKIRSGKMRGRVSDLLPVLDGLKERSKKALDQWSLLADRMAEGLPSFDYENFGRKTGSGPPPKPPIDFKAGEAAVKQLEKQKIALENITEAEKILKNIRLGGGNYTKQHAKLIAQLTEENRLTQAVAAANKRADDAEITKRLDAEAKAARISKEKADEFIKSSHALMEAAKREEQANKDKAESYRDLIDPMRAVLREINELAINKNLTDIEKAAATAVLWKQYSGAVSETNTQLEETERLLERMKADTAGVFTDAIFGAESLGDALRQLAIDFAKLIVQQQLFKGVTAVLGAINGTSPVGQTFQGDQFGPSYQGQNNPRIGITRDKSVTYNTYNIPADLTIGQVESAIGRANKSTVGSLYDARVRGGVPA